MRWTAWFSIERRGGSRHNTPFGDVGHMPLSRFSRRPWQVTRTPSPGTWPGRWPALIQALRGWGRSRPAPGQPGPGAMVPTTQGTRAPDSWTMSCRRANRAGRPDAAAGPRCSSGASRTVRSRRPAALFGRAGAQSAAEDRRADCPGGQKHRSGLGCSSPNGPGAAGPP